MRLEVPPYQSSFVERAESSSQVKTRSAAILERVKVRDWWGDGSGEGLRSE